MERRKASDYPPEVMRLFNGYAHGAITRREFLDRAAKFAVGGFTAAAMLESLRPDFARAQQVAPNDVRIRTQYATYSSPHGSGAMRGYLALPAKAAGRLPGVLVIHENRGVNPHIEDVARRFALLDFVAFAPDALTPLGGYPGDEEKAAQLFRKLDTARRIEDMVAAAGHLKARPECTGRIGVVGFCNGGGVVNLLATRIADLGAAVPFYGNAAPVADVPKINAPLQIHLASDDERVNAQYPAYESALKAHGKRYELHVYPGTLHAFHSDTTPRYNEAAAKLAWQRTIDFFNQHVRGG